MNINEKGIDQSGFDQIFNQWYEPNWNFVILYQDKTFPFGRGRDHRFGF